jgi:hypothetical protein
MKFYVSLVRDLLGYYLEIEADSKVTVRQYLCNEYWRKGTWLLPWCEVYDEKQLEEAGLTSADDKIIKARCGKLTGSMFAE